MYKSTEEPRFSNKTPLTNTNTSWVSTEEMETINVSIKIRVLCLLFCLSLKFTVGSLLQPRIRG